MVVPIILMLIGVVFFAKALGFIDQETVTLLWPLLVVVLGLSMLTNRMFGSCCEDGTCWSCKSGVGGFKRKKKRK